LPKTARFLSAVKMFPLAIGNKELSIPWICKAGCATGDLGELDAKGNLRFRGRKKNVIVTPAGLNVYPEDLEAQIARAAGDSRQRRDSRSNKAAMLNLVPFCFPRIGITALPARPWRPPRAVRMPSITPTADSRSISESVPG